MLTAINQRKVPLLSFNYGADLVAMKLLLIIHARKILVL